MNNAEIRSILIVDDDPKLRALLTRYLTQSGFSVVACANGMEMRVQLAEVSFKAVILDLMLQSENGLDLLKWIQGHQPTPTLILSAKGNEEDRILGLELGADDYLSKPFNPRELVARLNNLLKRHHDMPSQSACYKFDKWRFYPSKQLVRTASDEIVLSTTETELLSLFCRHPHTPLDRDFIMRSLKGYEHQATDRTVDVRVKRLRQKLQTIPLPKDPIQTVWGKGYVFHSNEVD